MATRPPQTTLGKAAATCALLTCFGVAMAVPFRAAPRALQGTSDADVARSVGQFLAQNVGLLSVNPSCSGGQALCSWVGLVLTATLLAATALCALWIWTRDRTLTWGRPVRVGFGFASLIGLLCLLSQTAVGESLPPHLPGDSHWTHPVAPGLILPVGMYVCGLLCAWRRSVR